MEVFQNLLIEKYRPRTLSDIVLSDDNRAAFEKFKQEGSIPNLLFTGNAGIGKSSLAKILVKDVLGCQSMYLNCSDENGIDTIRSKVVGFAQTKSIDGKIKVIILDEADGISGEGSRALRNTMDEYSSICRFILTGNYLHRILPALQSRCISFDLTPPLDKVLDRLKFVLSSEKIDFDIKDVETIARNNYPDLRKCIGDLQKYSKTGKLVVPTESECKEFVETIYKLVRANKVLQVRKWVIENEIKFSSDYQNLLRQLFNLVYEQKIDDNLKKQYMIIIAEFIFRSQQCLDQEINFYATILQMSEIK